MPRSGSNRTYTNSAQGKFPGNECRGDSPIRHFEGDLGDLSRQMLSRLNHTIEGDIIPRLMLAFDPPRPTAASAVPPEFRLEDSVEELTHLLLKHDATVATNFVSALRSDGISLTSIYLDLLAPAARRLGELWERDECTFTDVTIGVCRMHQVLLEFSRCFDATADLASTGQDLLILPVPGEQHTFGIFMVMEFLRRAGWNCFGGSPASKNEFHRLVLAHDFEAIGISVSADLHLETAVELIGEIRNGPRNANAVILVGGRVFQSNPSLAEQIGADAMAADGQAAVREITILCRNAKGPSTS